MNPLINKFKIFIEEYLKKIKVDSYICNINLEKEEKITTNNLKYSSYEEFEILEVKLKIFFQEKKYISLWSGSDLEDFQKELFKLPDIFDKLQKSDFYIKENFFSPPIFLEEKKKTFSILEMKNHINIIFEKLKSLSPNLVEEILQFSNFFEESFIFNEKNYLNHKVVSFSNLFSNLVLTENQEKYTYFLNQILDNDLDLLEFEKSFNILQKFSQKISLPTGKYPIIFSNKVSYNLILMIIKAMNGYHVWNKNSFLLNKFHEKIFDENINIIEDPFIKGSIYNNQVDMEGVEIEKKYLVKNGIIQNMLLDREYGEKFKLNSTGNSWNFSIGWTNIFLQPSHYSLEDLIHSSSEVLLVLDVIGNGFSFHDGEISVSVKGLYYKDGIFVATFKGTINNNIINILSEVKIANDIIFDSDVTSPSILVSPMTFTNEKQE